MPLALSWGIVCIRQKKELDLYDSTMHKEDKKPTKIRFEAAPLDDYATRITSGIAYMGGVLLLPLLFSFLSGIRINALFIPAALSLALLVFLLVCYCMQPTVYEVASDRVLVRRRFWPALKIPFSEIQAVSIAASMADLPRFGLRSAFNAGVFGYLGPFQLHPYGRVFFVATNSRRLVAIARFHKLPMLLSPLQSAAFIEALNHQRLNSAMGALEFDRPQST